MSRCSFGRAMTNACTTVMNVQCLDTCIDRYMSVFMRYALPIPIQAVLILRFYLYGIG